MVGAVVVFNDHIIGEGYHNKFGGPHAEVIAIRSVKDPGHLKNSTLYVNLEPCAHYGKTPPCSLLIKESGISRVVIGCSDSNPEVAGKGVRILRDAGSKVLTGILEEESRFLNRRFLTFQEKKRPYIILKWAETKDGFIDRDREKTGSNEATWITNSTARMLVHKWRSEEIAIMAGTQTILLDNPELNLRYWPGESPLRVVPDKNGRLFDNLKIKNGLTPTLIFSGDQRVSSKNLSYVQLPFENFVIPTFLEELYNRQILSVFVEGGANLIQNFIQSGLWDEALVFVGDKSFGAGLKAPMLECGPQEKMEFRNCKLIVYKNNF
jgi:diaminohydroxyphosphoribosylaminopyrimidine deaminase/5-amino-6-(5-phosphoribosylamino)uracil reductase